MGITETTQIRGPVLVQWEDSRYSQQGWNEFEYMADEPCPVRSVGWIAKEAPNFIQLVPHIGDNPAQGCGDMCIPRSAIKSIKDLSDV